MEKVNSSKFAVDFVLHLFQKSQSNCQSFCLPVRLNTLFWDVLHTCSVGRFKCSLRLNSTLWVTLCSVKRAFILYMCVVMHSCAVFFL